VVERISSKSLLVKRKKRPKLGVREGSVRIAIE
jgi:hypothetical protein